MRPPSLLGFCLGWSSDFVGSEYGQIQSVKLLQNMISNTTQRPPPPPDTHCLYILYFDTGNGERGRDEPERRLEGQQFTKLGRKYQHGQIQSVTSAEYGLQQDSKSLTPSQPRTVCMYCTLTQGRGEGEGRVEPEKCERGNSSQS